MPWPEDPYVRPAGVRTPLNESWPETLPAAADTPRAVVARVVWPDGEVELATQALAWTETHVMVYILDERMDGRWALWLAAADVRAAAAGGGPG